MWVAVVCALAFGKQPAPPNVFEGIRVGMAVADAKLAAWQPDASYKDAANRTRLVRDAGDGARYYVLVAGDAVARIGIEAPEKGLVARIERAWGKPTVATNLANESITSWSSAGWRVDLSCRSELCRIAFHQPLTAAFFGGTPQPPGVLAGLRPGMSRAELVQLAPRYVARDVPAGPEDMRVTVDLAKNGHVQSVLVGGLPQNAPEILEKAWGASAESGDNRVWFDAQHNWRAELIDGVATLQFTGYVPGVNILGAGPGIALLSKPVLGASHDQIAASYAGLVRADGKGLAMELPPSEGGTGKLSIGFDQTTQRAKRLTIELPYDTEARREELLKLMSSKWGTPKSKSATLVFPTDKVTIECTDGAKRLVLRIALP